MNIEIPIALIAVAIVLYFFYSTNRRNRFVKDERKEARDAIRQRRQQIIEQTMAVQKDTRKDEPKNDFPPDK